MSRELRNPISHLVGRTLRTPDGGSIMVVRGYAGPGVYSVVLVRDEEATSWDYGSKDEAKAAAEAMFAELNAPRENPSRDENGRYVYVTACTNSCYEDIREMLDNHPVTSVSMATFKKAVGLEGWRNLTEQLGYDRHFPISKDWHVGYYKATFRGVPAYFLRHSGIEHIFTLDGEQGPSLIENPYRTEHSARQHSPKGYKSCGRVTIHHGDKPIGLITCSPTGRRSAHDTEVQSIRFPVEHWTPGAAKRWLRDHGYDASRFEAAHPVSRNPQITRDQFGEKYNRRAKLKLINSWADKAIEVIEHNTVVYVADARLQGIKSGGRWMLGCDRHGGYLQSSNKGSLLKTMSTPWTWCDECAEEHKEKGMDVANEGRTKRNPGMDVANEILRQLGGNRFIAMTGAKHIMGDENSLVCKLGRFPGVKVQMLRVTLDPDDTYTMEFMAIRKHEAKVLDSVSGVYADNLRRVFEEHTGLRTSL